LAIDRFGNSQHNVLAAHVRALILERSRRDHWPLQFRVPDVLVKRLNRLFRRWRRSRSARLLSSD
jgi:hypothetical protein